MSNTIFHISKIIMLPSGETVTTKPFDEKIIINSHDKLQLGNPIAPIEKAQHLYFLDDAMDIMRGDYYYDAELNTIGKAYSLELVDIGCSRMVASTDSKMNLPKPSDKFIQQYIDAYNTNCKIDKVLIKYTESMLVDINDENEIVIKISKNDYDRKEVIDIIYQLLKATGKEIEAKMVGVGTGNAHIVYDGDDLVNWISNNV